MIGQPVNEVMTIGVDNDVMTAHGGAMTTATGEARTLTRSQGARLAQCDAAAQAKLRALRLELLTELRADGWTLRELATLMRCTKQRVAVMLRAR